MTTLYRPVLITSAEQAEALPAGTSVKRAVWHQSGHQDYYAGVKVGSNAWFTTAPTADLQDALSRHMIGWTALVPIEAEEEWALIYDGQEPTPCADEADARKWARIDGEGLAPSRRYTTVWEATS